MPASNELSFEHFHTVRSQVAAAGGRDVRSDDGKRRLNSFGRHGYRVVYDDGKGRLSTLWSDLGEGLLVYLGEAFITRRRSFSFKTQHDALCLTIGGEVVSPESLALNCRKPENPPITLPRVLPIRVNAGAEQEVGLEGNGHICFAGLICRSDAARSVSHVTQSIVALAEWHADFVEQYAGIGEAGQQIRDHYITTSVRRLFSTPFLDDTAEALLHASFLEILAQSKTSLQLVAGAERASSHRERRLENLCRAIAATPTDETTLAEYACQLNMAERTIARYFERSHNTTFTEFRRSARLDLASRHLRRYPGRSVSDIAFAAGYR
ncbi:MAG: helix-turn-helix domain-containing protein, partial [Pseudomonadota bacterium]